MGTAIIVSRFAYLENYMKSLLLSSLLGLTILNSSLTFTESLPKSVSPEPILEYSQISKFTQFSTQSSDLGVSKSGEGLEKIRQEYAQKAEEKRKADEEARIRAEEEAKQAEIKKQQEQAKAQVAKASTYTQSTSAPIVPTGDVQAYAQSRVCAEFGCDQWNAFHFIILKESTWNYKAINPSSGAGGLCQSLPFSKMATAGADYQTNPNTQIEWCISYIRGRYKTPAGAQAFWTANRWF